MKLYLIQFPKRSEPSVTAGSVGQTENCKNAYTESVEKYDYNGTVMELKASVKEDKRKWTGFQRFLESRCSWQQDLIPAVI